MDLIGGQIRVLGVNFRAEFEFLTENDQKRQFKAVLFDLLGFRFLKKSSNRRFWSKMIIEKMKNGQKSTQK